MTAVSLINPYAPQPVSGIPTDFGYAAGQSTTPITPSGSSGDAGPSSDQSGQGAGNGTSTGGPQVTELLKRGRSNTPPQSPTLKSVVEAQSESDPATEFLERQARQKIDAKAAEEARVADRAAARASEAKAEADRAALPVYVMPNPLPTAPILQRDET